MERWILGRLRNRRFHSLGELNEAMNGGSFQSSVHEVFGL
jgi:hypothetical protein